MTEKILIIEDDITLQEILVYNLSRQGYDVKAAENGEEGLDLVRRFSPDLLILDVMLPVLDGLEICRILRGEMTIPILMLTAKDAEIDRVVGLEMGADDYLTKPFSMRELIARVKALLRRVKLDLEKKETNQLEEKKKEIKLNDLSVNIVRREVFINETQVQLKPKEYDLLLFIVKNKGQVLSRELILDRVWGWDFSGGSRTVDVHMRWLREKIERDPAHPQKIVTVHGVGYRFDG